MRFAGGRVLGKTFELNSLRAGIGPYRMRIWRLISLVPITSRGRGLGPPAPAWRGGGLDNAPNNMVELLRQWRGTAFALGVSDKRDSTASCKSPITEQAHRIRCVLSRAQTAHSAPCAEYRSRSYCHCEVLLPSRRIQIDCSMIGHSWHGNISASAEACRSIP